MGNCLKTNKVMAQDEPSDFSSSYSPPTEAKKAEDRPAAGSAMAKPKSADQARSGAPSKKVVRFKLQEDEDSAGGEVIGKRGCDGGAEAGGVLRIKVVVSQKELKQMLKERENSSCTLEELIAELKVKGRTTISDARTDGVEDQNGTRRPALECIPEELH